MHELNQEQVDTVLNALHLAKTEFLFHGGCIETDRPDLPLFSDTSWTVDFSRVIEVTDAAAAMLGDDQDRTDPECKRCSTCLPIEPTEVLARHEAEPLGSRTPEGSL